MSAKFASKLGIIATTVGSAVGLGNVWRFPAEVQSNGGAAFLLVYFLCVLLLGIPVMLCEFSLGRAGGMDAVNSFRKLTPDKPWWITGVLGILASYLIFSFYLVVAGWTFEYMIQSITGQLYQPIEGMSSAQMFTAKMHNYIETDFSPLINTFIIIALNLVILVFGVQKGIERISNILMPTLFVLLIIFCFVSLSLPGASGGVEFFFHADLTKITPSVVVNALGQAFFSLSLGMGVLITYSSYFPKNTNLTKTAFTVSFFDMLVAIMMGLIIFPAVVSFGLQNESLQGQTLVFVTLPEVFNRMHYTGLWSTLFFLTLSVAAITSTISMAEVCVAFMENRFKMSRVKATAVVVLPTVVLSSLCSLSLGSWKFLSLWGQSLFNIFDNIATNILLPIGALLICIYVGWVLPSKTIRAQFTNDGTIRNPLVDVIMFCIRYIAPPAILIILIASIISLC